MIYQILIQKKYPIKTELYNSNLELVDKTYYSSLKLENNGAKLLLPIQELEVINKLEESHYKTRFFQGATLVPRTLVFFSKKQKKNGYLIISSDLEVLSRSKKQWKFRFEKKEIEEKFQFKTFLNMDMIPFYIKQTKDVFLPVNEDLEFNIDFLKKHHGMVLVNVHPDCLADSIGWKIYADFLHDIKKSGYYWNALPKDVASWWRKRSVRCILAASMTR